jgi:ABC-type enterobactin transport system permease subunit
MVAAMVAAMVATVATAVASSLLAHQGGWDEFLLVAAPVAVIAALLAIAKRRVDRAEARVTGSSGAGSSGAGSSSTGSSSTGSSGDASTRERSAGGHPFDAGTDGS